MINKQRQLTSVLTVKLRCQIHTIKFLLVLHYLNTNNEKTFVINKLKYQFKKFFQLWQVTIFLRDRLYCIIHADEYTKA